MKLKQNSSKQKLRGAYYTPLPIAKKMVELFDYENIHKVLEPSCGDGVFLDAISNTGIIERIDCFKAIEINQEEAEKVEQRYCKNTKISIHKQDFFDYYFEHYTKEKYDLILGNPPYIRYQYLDDIQRERMSQILTMHGMKANKLINTWVGFTVACAQMLSESGKLAFVVPSEILQVAYAADLRLFLADTFTRITLITFEELVFPDIEQEVVILIGEKGGEEKGIRIIELKNLDDLERADIQSNAYQKLQHVHEKWTKYFTNIGENELISQIRQDRRFQKLSDVALINVGITTGNNKYFSVNKTIVEKYDLISVTRPLIGRSAHANSVYFNYEDWQANVEKGKNAYLIDFPDIPYDEYPEKHKMYIEMGKKNNEHIGYKCRIRERWYRIPSIWVPDAFFLRRNNLFPKFVQNKCNAVSTDTMHRIKFNDDQEPERIILSYYNSISFAFAELSGRSYGGGVLEILPGEVGNIIVPNLEDVPIGVIRTVLEEVDHSIREGKDIEKVLDMVDDEILIQRVGIQEDWCEESRKVWKKMQRRRLSRGYN